MAPDETVTLTRAATPGRAVVEVEIPRELGSIRLVREIGRGGMGVVWLGHDTMLDRDVAVKFLLGAEAGSDDPGFTRFLEGAQAAAAVRHPGLTAIHHADLVDDVPYIVMEYVDGPTLADLLKHPKHLSPAMALAALEPAVSAIGELHDRDIIHRDVKPSNVLLDADGQVFVTDFGLACARPSSGPGATRGRLAGTPAYMAPEMFEGAVSTRSDVYALGVMTYELLVGARPFKGTTPELRDKHLRAPLPCEPLAQRDIDAGLIEVLERATHKNALYRYKTARQFLRALQQAIPEAAATTRPGMDLGSLVARTRGQADRSETPADAGSTDSNSYFERLSTLAARKSRDKAAPVVGAPVAPASEDEHPICAQRGSEVPELPGPPTDLPPDAIRVDVPCAQCAYNLRSLSAAGNCPQCNSPISGSLQPDRLIFADPRWLAHFVWMMTLSWATTKKLLWPSILIIAILIIAIVVVEALSLLWGSYEAFDRVKDVLLVLFALAVLHAGFVSMWVHTTREPGRASNPSVTAMRWSIRLCLSVFAALALPLLALVAGMELGSWYGPLGEVIILSRYAEFLWIGSGCTAAISMFLYWRTLAVRIPAPESARRMRWWIALWAAIPILTVARWAMSRHLVPPEIRSAWMTEMPGILESFWIVRMVYEWMKLGLIESQALSQLLSQTVLMFVAFIPEFLFLFMFVLSSVEQLLFWRALKRVADASVPHEALFGDRAVAADSGGGADDAFVRSFKATYVRVAVALVLFLAAYAGASWGYVAQRTSSNDVAPLIQSMSTLDSFPEDAMAEVLRHGKGPLLAALNDDDRRVRRFAAEALGQLADPTTIPDLLGVLDDRDSRTRRKAIGALGKIGDRSIVSHLVRKLKDPTYIVRSAAASALAELKATEAVPALVNLLEHRSPHTVAGAARALGELGNETVVAHLLPLLNGPEQDVADSALLSIARIDGQTFHELPLPERVPATQAWWEREGKRKYASAQDRTPPAATVP